VEGFCDHGNEPSGSIKCWDIASQERLSCMKLKCFFVVLVLPSVDDRQWPKHSRQIFILNFFHVMDLATHSCIQNPT
jgi:hypothetical protein